METSPPSQLPPWVRSLSLALLSLFLSFMDCPDGSDSKASIYNVGDLGSIPGSGRFPEEGNGNPLQYSCLENPMDGGAWCPWCCKESDTTERLHFHFIFIFRPTSFRREWAAFLDAWCPLPAFRSFFVEFAQCSNDLSVNF